MNVEGADVERRLGRSLMPRLHAGFSLGTVGGRRDRGRGGRGRRPARRAGLRGSRSLAPLSMAVATRRFLGVVPVAKPVEEGAARRFGARDAWREPRTLLVGLMVLGFAFTEGSANDWMAVAMVDGYGTVEAVGAMGFGVFVAAMTVAGCSAAPRSNGSGASRCCGRRPCSGSRACCSSCSVGLRRWRWRAPCCGASAPRSASRWG